MIKIQFFASLRERLGLANLNLEYNGQQSVDVVKNQLLERGDEWQLLAENNVLSALNQSVCQPNAIVNDGDEIAFFPPVTGG
jgi:molybdopterin synthase sulfur carrier subunit